MALAAQYRIVFTELITSERWPSKEEPSRARFGCGQELIVELWL